MSHRALNNVGRWLPCLRHTSSCIRIVSTLVWQTLTSNFIMFCFCFLFRYHNSEFSFPVQVFGAGSSRSQKCEDRSAVVVQEIAKQIWTPKASVYLKRKVPQKVRKYHGWYHLHCHVWTLFFLPRLDQPILYCWLMVMSHQHPLQFISIPLNYITIIHHTYNLYNQKVVWHHFNDMLLVYLCAGDKKHMDSTVARCAGDRFQLQPWGGR